MNHRRRSRAALIFCIVLALPSGVAAAFDLPSPSDEVAGALIPAPAPIASDGTGHSCEPDGDAGSKAATAQLLPHPFRCVGELTAVDLEGPKVDDVDRFAFDLAAGEVVDIAVTTGNLHIHVCARDPQDRSAGCGELLNSTAHVQIGPGAGRWTVSVWTMTGTGYGEYTLDASSGSTDIGDDCGSGRDAPHQSEGWSDVEEVLVGFPADCAGEFGEGDTADWYKVNLSAQSFLEIRLTSDPDTDSRLCILAPDFASYSCFFVLTDGFVSVQVATDGDAGMWHVGAYRGWQDPDSPYRLEILERDAPETRDDCASGGDASWRRELALPLEWPVSCGALIDEFDNRDVYAFEVERDQFVNVTLDSPTHVMVGCVYGPDGRGKCERGGEETTVQFGDKDGTWLLVVSTADVPHPTQYTLDIQTLDRPLQDDCGIGRDAQDRLDAGWDAIPYPVECTGAIDELDEGDYFSVNLSAGDLVEVEFRFEGGEDRLACLLSPTQTQYFCTWDWYTDDSFFHRVFTVTEGGTWRLNVYPSSWSWGSSGWSNYSILLRPAAAAPAQDDCGLGRDARNGADEPVAFPGSCTGLLDALYGDYWDIYDLAVPEGDAWRVVVDGPPDADVCVLAGWQYSCGTSYSSFWYSGPVRVYVGPRDDLAAYSYTVRFERAETQSASGAFLVGNPAGDFVSHDRDAGPDSGRDLDGSWLKLAQPVVEGGAQQFTFDTDGARFATADFYDANFTRLDGRCERQTCHSPPVGAAWVFLQAQGGVDIHWTATYRYFPESP